MLGGASMIIDSHAHYNNNAYKKPFRYLSYDKDGYALKEGDREQLFQELVDAKIPYSIEPGVSLQSCEEVLQLCAEYPDRIFPAIEVRLSKGKSLTDKDILVIGKRKKTEKDPEKTKENTPKQETDKKSTPKTKDPSDPGNMVYDLSRFKKKTFSVSLYPEEYDRLMDTIQKSGYKRSEFILASSVSATEKRMASAQKKVVIARKELRKEEKELKAKITPAFN